MLARCQVRYGVNMTPEWFSNLLSIEQSDVNFKKENTEFHLVDGIFRAQNLLSEAQSQTKDTFGFKWAKEDTFDSEASSSRMKEWLQQRYGDISEFLNTCDATPLILDAGCGAGFTFLDLWEPYLDNIKYVGVDVSSAVEVAKKRFKARGYNDFAFLQSCITDLPFEEEVFDIIYSEGVLHHTDNTRNSFHYLCNFVKPNGYFMFYVYKKKSPVREYTDDYIRNELQSLTTHDAWNKLKPLTSLGIQLGELDTDITIKDDIDLLGIKSGTYDIQRFFYWFVCKAFYNPELTFEEMHHINYDWYAPMNAHRHTPEEVRSWCKEANFEIVSERIEDAGITVIARKK